VSASIPLDLAWRDNTRRRSCALAELTRYTVWPRWLKNTAIGSQEGPVGSSTTSRQTPGVAPTRAACSTSTRLARVGSALRRHTMVPSPASTRTVWTLVIPRSIPTNRRSCMPPPCWSWSAPAAPMGDAVPGHGPRVVAASDDGSHSCAATGPGPGGPGHFPHPGHPWPAKGGNQVNEAWRQRAILRAVLNATPGTSRDVHATLEPGVDQAPRSLT
jgi:hypothetical protein